MPTVEPAARASASLQPMYLRHVPPWPEAQRPPGAPRSELWVPRAGLASCVRGIISRDTRGAALTEAQRYNHFPAAPTCALLWYLQGECELLAPGSRPMPGSPRTPVAPIGFCGPFTQPTLSFNPGPMHAFMVLLMPDAVVHLTGLDPAALRDRIVPVEQLLDADWQLLCRQVAEAPDDGTRVALFETFVLPRWRRTRPASALGSHHLADWATSVVLQAATSGPGRSLRQVQRRFKRWTGHTQRELIGLGRAERSFFGAVGAQRSGQVDWAALADQAGYADQAHLCRECRRVTGLPPEALRRRVLDDEAFWAYRLWGLGADGGPEDV